MQTRGLKPATLSGTQEEINLAIVDTLQLPSCNAVQGLLVHLQVESLVSFPDVHRLKEVRLAYCVY